MIYLRSFTISDDRLSCQNIYPYNVFRNREGVTFYFDGVTVFYGNNGSGKSTLLNAIAFTLDMKGKELATPNTFGNDNYCLRFSNECKVGFGEDERGKKLHALPKDSRYIKSEDILYEIKKIQQRQILSDGMVYDRMKKGESYEEASAFLETKMGRKQQSYIEFSQEKFSNGETALQFFQDFLLPDALYLLDEPEVSLSPQNQVELAKMINEMTRLLGCQFIIATHSPFMLGTLNAKIYDMDSGDFRVTEWSKLPNVRYFYEFFKKHESEFSEEM